MNWTTAWGAQDQAPGIPEVQCDYVFSWHGETNFVRGQVRSSDWENGSLRLYKEIQGAFIGVGATYAGKPRIDSVTINLWGTSAYAPGDSLLLQSADMPITDPQGKVVTVNSLSVSCEFATKR